MHVRLIAAIGVAGALALVAGCGSSGSSSPPTTPDSPASAATAPGSSAPAAAGGGTTVNVTETSFKIALDTSSFTAGTYTFAIKNEAQIPHALTVDGPGIEDRSSGTIAGGSIGTLTVTLQQGSYEIYCPIGDHKMEGMDLHVAVT